MTGAVLAAYLHPNKVSHSFSDSLMRLVAYDAAHRRQVIRSGGPVMFRCGPGGLEQARNQVMAHFLDNTTCEWLWTVDSDMGFAPDTVERLVKAADPEKAPVVGGLCFGLKEVAPDGMNGWHVRAFPTLYTWAKDQQGVFGFRIVRSYPQDQMMQVAGTGSACMLIHRTVAEKIRAGSGDRWYDRTYQSNGTAVSEDLSFCYRVNQAGYPVHVHTGVQTTHHKEIWLGQDLYRLLETQYRNNPTLQGKP